jgi:hypothetical protein
MDKQVQPETARAGQVVKVYRIGHGFVEAIIRLVLEKDRLIQVVHTDGATSFHAFTA